MEANEFWQQVNIAGPDECWLWQGKTSSKGYGLVEVNGKLTNAHRHAFELVNGPLPPDILVCHSCDTPLCCNTNHHWLGSHKENARDRDSKGRRKPLTGTRHGRSKFSDVDIADIRMALSQGESLRRIANRYGTNKAVISRIKRNKTYINQSEFYHEPQ